MVRRDQFAFDEKWVKKGSGVYVEGKIRTRSYDDQSGVKRYVTEIHADRIEFYNTGTRPADGTATNAGNGFQQGGQPQATQQANEIVNKAIEDANALRTGAIAYTDDMMGSMEQTLAQGLDGLKEKYEEMLSTMNTTVETISANRKELPKAEDVIISAAPADTAEEEQSEEE